MQINGHNVYYFNKMRKKLDTLLVKDDSYWRQRDKKFCYRYGDLNTCFFLVVASAGRKINHIAQLEKMRMIQCVHLY
jgi:hypothetical protein